MWFILLASTIFLTVLYAEKSKSVTRKKLKIEEFEITTDELLRVLDFLRRYDIITNKECNRIIIESSEHLGRIKRPSKY